MSTRAGTVPLSDLQFLKIYFNKRRLRSTPANLRKILAETGGDAICNGSIFLRDLSPACHLKADGQTRKAPMPSLTGVISMISPGSTTGLSVFASSFMLSTGTPFIDATLFRL